MGGMGLLVGRGVSEEVGIGDTEGEGSGELVISGEGLGVALLDEDEQAASVNASRIPNSTRNFSFMLPSPFMLVSNARIIPLGKCSRATPEKA